MDTLLDGVRRDVNARCCGARRAVAAVRDAQSSEFAVFELAVRAKPVRIKEGSGKCHRATLISAIGRREFISGSAATIAAAVIFGRDAAEAQPTSPFEENDKMNSITTSGGTQIFYKDWGTGTPIVFHHGWPLTSDDWDTQMLFFLSKGYRVIAHDRRGHGRSTQTPTGNDMNTYAADVATLTDHLDLRGAIHVGHSAGGGEVTRYVARAKPGRVAKAVLIGAVPPIMLKTKANPSGQPIENFDVFRTALAANRAQLFLDLSTGPFYSFNRPGAKVSEGLIRNWWRQGMAGCAKSQYDCIKAWSETDFTEDLKQISVPVLVMHGDDDQVVPIEDSALLAIKLLKHGTLKVYNGYSHGMAATHAAQINADILAFIEG
jgi:non-heme chloroperoxidase